jgi:hypothetical protein
MPATGSWGSAFGRTDYQTGPVVASAFSQTAALTDRPWDARCGYYKPVWLTEATPQWLTGLDVPEISCTAATIYAAIIREIANKGDNTRFRKTDRGQFEAVAARQ